MPRNYIPAFPDIRGQRYERVLISETQTSPLDTAADLRGITGSVITSGAEGEVRTPTVRRYRFRLGWDYLTTEEAVDVEYAAVELCADGNGVCPFIEWEPTSELEYPGDLFALWPGKVTGATPYVGPFHWWDFDPAYVSIVPALGEDPVFATLTSDDTWLGNIPTFSVAAPAHARYYATLYAPLFHAPRRIRLVTIEPGTYIRDKSKIPDRWAVSVTLVEKETGIAPGYAR
ncbi:MAG TPA: hypothetical protein VF761_17225 [Gemmatimonadaceae bacterium]